MLDSPCPVLAARRARWLPAAACGGLGWLVSGCAATTSSLTPPGPGTQPLAPVASPLATPGNETILALGSSPTLDVSAVTLYQRVASGALKCWFGPLGPLRPTHVFNGETMPPSAGGAAEITIHERDPLAARTTGVAASRSLRSFRIAMTPVAEGKSRLSMEVGKLPADLAAAMEADTLAYAFARESCKVQEVRPPPPPPVPVTKKRKAAPAATARRP
jgi:hypothetical protein